MPLIIGAYSNKYKFNSYQVFGTIVSKLIYVSYFNLYPDNIFSNQTDIQHAVLFSTIICIQAAILLYLYFRPRNADNFNPISMIELAENISNVTQERTESDERTF